MAGESEALARCLAHNQLLAEFGKHALSETPLDALLQEATELVAEGTGVRHAKVMRYRPETDDLLMVAGVGWRPGVVGRVALSSAMNSPPGRAFRTGEPVCIPDLPNTDAYEYSDVLREHGIVSVLNVPIAMPGAVWGVFEVDSARLGATALHEAPFLAAFANLIAHAIRQRGVAEERAAVALDREVQLRKREVLFRELHHRVNNNFHAIAGLIDIELSRAPPGARDGFARLAERMGAIIDAHEHLALRDVERDIGLGFYLGNLLGALRGPDNVRLTRRIAETTVPLRIAVRLGMIVNEMVTNSLKHAFDPARGGTIEVALEVDEKSRSGRLVVADDGRGMPPDPRRGSGLTLVEALVEQIGGRLTRANRPSGGLERVVVFPLDFSSAAA
jgi:two-component sensor histidine kinase